MSHYISDVDKPTLFGAEQKFLPKKLFVRKFSAAEVEDVNCAVFIIYAKISFSLDLLTSKVAIYCDTLTSAIWKSRHWHRHWHSITNIVFYTV